jgi:hypothetical protein
MCNNRGNNRKIQCSNLRLRKTYVMEPCKSSEFGIRVNPTLEIDVVSLFYVSRLQFGSELEANDGWI